MADMMQLLIDIFKISQYNVNQYSMASPLEQIFYLFFFPSLFIIVLIFIVTRFITQHKGINLMIALALYAFIIFQGLYNWFVFLSPYWLFGLILLAFIYLILGRLGQPRGGGGAQGKTLGGAGGWGSAIGKRLWKQIDREIPDLEKMLATELGILEGILKDMKTKHGMSDLGDVYRAFTEHNRTVNDLLQQYRNSLSMKGMRLGGKYDSFLKRYQKLSKDIQKVWTSKGGKGG